MPEAKNATAPWPNPIPPVYESNPFNLITASIEAYKVNLRGLVYALALVLGFIGLSIVLAITFIAIGFTTGVSALALPFAIGAALWVLLAVLGGIYIGSYLLVIMLAASQGQRLDIKDASGQAVRLIPRLFVVTFLYNLIFVVGLILFIVPGIIWGGWFYLAPIVAVQEKLGPIESLRRSRELVRGHFVETWGLIGLQSTILALAMFASGPIRYFQLVSVKSGQLQKTETHWSNYVAILIGVVFSGVANFQIPAEDRPKQPQPTQQEQSLDDYQT